MHTHAHTLKCVPRPLFVDEVERQPLHSNINNLFLISTETWFGSRPHTHIHTHRERGMYVLAFQLLFPSNTMHQETALFSA